MPSRQRASPQSAGAGSSANFTVPLHTKDPVWSLQPSPVTFTVAGVEYEIPAVPAVDWLMILMADQVDLDRILIELCPKAIELLFDESLGQEPLYDLLLDVLGEVSGRHWWITLRLIHTIRGNWNVLGAEMFLRNIDPARMSLSGWLDAMFIVTLRAMDQKDLTLFVTRLEAPPEGEELDPEDFEMSRDQFLSMA